MKTFIVTAEVCISVWESKQQGRIGYYHNKARMVKARSEKAAASKMRRDIQKTFSHIYGKNNNDRHRPLLEVKSLIVMEHEQFVYDTEPGKVLI